MSIAIIAEKPSVARDIAAVVGARERGHAAWRGNGYVVSWALGHLVGLAEPHVIDPAWKPWRAERLPMLPRLWPLCAFDKTKTHFASLKALLCGADVESVICATDAGREGELIFRYIYRLAGCTKAVERLWISSLTPAAIRAGMKALRPAAAFDCLAAAAEGRARADWLVGLNLTRAYTLRAGGELRSVGRVQTPTLALVAARDAAIAAFVPERYCELAATFARGDDTYVGTWFEATKEREADHERQTQRLPADGVLAGEIRARCLDAEGLVIRVTGSDKRLPPPLLYDLTELQRHANRLYGLTAKATLEVAQALYEKHKLLSYPRTDSRHLTAAAAAELGPVVAAIAPGYGDLLAPGSGERPLSRRFVDDAEVRDHHALIPTPLARAGKRLSHDEARVYDLVCRRLLMAWHDSHDSRVTTVVTRVRSGQAVDDFRSHGTVVTRVGWKALELEPRRGRGDGGRGSRAGHDEPVRLPDGLANGQRPRVRELEVRAKATAAPKPYTDASLLTAMQTAGRTLSARELEQALRERGLGTPATRAGIIETLLTRGYLTRRGKALGTTSLGFDLVNLVDDKVKSPALTAEWELFLERIAAGEGSLADFQGGIEMWVTELVGQALRGAKGGGESTSCSLEGRLVGMVSRATRPILSPPQDERVTVHDISIEEINEALGAASRDADGGGFGHEHGSGGGFEPAAAEGGTLGRRNATVTYSGADAAARLLPLLRERLGYPDFRAHQEEICRSVTSGQDALVVMPTGSGKSLCYQLPGLARGGTALVISPLIALMQDQVHKLCHQGVKAAALHSGAAREVARAVWNDYERGLLEVLLVAPERLALSGFMDLLARRPPNLVAIDEAHCISHWGHDFRPDYRLLGERLPAMRPAPVVALTATATVRVQDDIVSQLGIKGAQRFIRGFRRDNLGVEAIELGRAERLPYAASLLRDPARRPAIVYVPSRKLAMEVSAALAPELSCAPYHAGLPPEVRSRTQTAFLAGELDIVVATIAFGMGVDKPNIRTVIHLGMPSTLEGYYQEIGRAGRDAKPARAVLLWSWGDRKIHESFLERDYPDAKVLARLRAAVPAAGIAREALLAPSANEPDAREAALDKLWIHGGVTVDGEDVVRTGHDAWQAPYLAIRNHRHAQLDEVMEFAQAGDCRMVRLVRYFGETRDKQACGICDACAPKDCIGRRFRGADDSERDAALEIVGALEERDGLATGTLYRTLHPSEDVPRKDFERLLAALGRAGLVSLHDDTFEKDGAMIRFRRARLATAARKKLMAEGLLIEDVAATGHGGASSATKARKKTRPWRRSATSDEEKGQAASSRASGAPAQAEAMPAADPALVDRLRAWRLGLARSQGVPAFRIMTDRTLHGIAATRPRSLAELLGVHGAGPRLAEKHGAALLRLTAEP